jgi:hypothetical protein
MLLKSPFLIIICLLIVAMPVFVVVKIVQSRQARRNPAASPVAIVVPPQERRIELRNSGAVANTGLYALSFLVSGIAMLVFPDLLRTRWLSYPVGFILLLLGGLCVYITWNQKKEVIIADRNGIEVRAAGQMIDKVEWSQVGTVKILTIEYRRSRTAIATSKDRYFLLEDRSGNELFRAEAPLDPPEAYKLFLDSVPSWTGLKILHETETGAKKTIEE